MDYRIPYFEFCSKHNQQIVINVGAHAARAFMFTIFPLLDMKKTAIGCHGNRLSIKIYFCLSSSHNIFAESCGSNICFSSESQQSSLRMENFVVCVFSVKLCQWASISLFIKTLHSVLKKINFFEFSSCKYSKTQIDGNRYYAPKANIDFHLANTKYLLLIGYFWAH